MHNWLLISRETVQLIRSECSKISVNLVIIFLLSHLSSSLFSLNFIFRSCDIYWVNRIVFLSIVAENAYFQSKTFCSTFKYKSYQKWAVYENSKDMLFKVIKNFYFFKSLFSVFNHRKKNKHLSRKVILRRTRTAV